MTRKELQDAFFEKMFAEQESYRRRLIKMPIDYILNNAYQYAIREDLLYFLDDCADRLDDEEIEALLKLDEPLGEFIGVVYDDCSTYNEWLTNAFECFAWSETQRRRKEEKGES